MIEGEGGDPDYAGAYRETRARVVDIVRSVPERELDTLVPATPEWRVRDVLAHVAGICDDIMNGNLDGIATEAWTAAHVDKRREWDVETVISDWEAGAAAVEPLFDAFPPGSAGQMVADAATHEHDVRGALGTPGARDSAAIVIGFEWGAERLNDRLRAEGSGSLRIETEFGSRELGVGTPARAVRADRFDLVRAFTGRRSLAQMRAFEWEGAFDPQGLLLFSFFTPAKHDILE